MRHKNILLVDDEKPILAALSNYLCKSGFSVQSASDGETALTQFRSTSFDLVITDFVMAGLNGIELLKEIKNTSYETGVFILTGHGDLPLAIDALQSGADDFLLKPCDTDTLLQKMNCFFDKQETFRKNTFSEKILPVCMYCKKIRDDIGAKPGTGKWLSMEEYLCLKSGAELSHGCCPECFAICMGEVEKNQ